MKMRLGDTVIELDNIAYAQKYTDRVVHIYFLSIEKPLSVSCETESGRAVYPGSCDEFLNMIETLGKTAEELEHIAAMISNPNR